MAVENGRKHDNFFFFSNRRIVTLGGEMFTLGSRRCQILSFELSHSSTLSVNGKNGNGRRVLSFMCTFVVVCLSMFVCMEIGLWRRGQEIEIQ